MSDCAILRVRPSSVVRGPLLVATNKEARVLAPDNGLLTGDFWRLNDHWFRGFFVGLWNPPSNTLLLSASALLLLMAFVAYLVWAEE